MEADEKSLRVLRGLYRMFGLLREQDKEMPVQQMLVLFYISFHEVAAQRDMPAALDMPPNTVSRNIAALADIHRPHKEGLGLITWVDDPSDRRAKNLTLTPKGRAFIRRVLDMIE